MPSAVFGDGVICLIDRNGSSPSACSAVPLAPNKLLHTGPLDAYDKAGAGVYLIDIPVRDRGDWHAAAQRNLFDRMIGPLYYCLKTGELFDEYRAFPSELVPRQATFARQGAASGACSRCAGRKSSYWTY
ncbi:hypothetical protein AB0J04_24295, partial [Streptomyces sp. NPDC050263]